VPPTLHARADEVIEEQFFCCGAFVRFWHKADIAGQARDVRFQG